jgi:hypothetical protein
LKKDKFRLEKEIDKLKHDSNFSKGLLEQTTKNTNVSAKKLDEANG